MVEGKNEQLFSHSSSNTSASPLALLIFFILGGLEWRFSLSSQKVDLNIILFPKQLKIIAVQLSQLLLEV